MEQNKENNHIAKAFLIFCILLDIVFFLAPIVLPGIVYPSVEHFDVGIMTWTQYNSLGDQLFGSLVILVVEILLLCAFKSLRILLIVPFAWLFI